MRSDLRLEKLKACMDAMPHGDLEKEATYLCDKVKVQMGSLREARGALVNGLGDLPITRSKIEAKREHQQSSSQGSSCPAALSPSPAKSRPWTKRRP